MIEWRLTKRLRTLITLATLTVLMVLGGTWGWAQVIKPFPGKAEAPLCVKTAYHAGDSLFVQEVTVSVLNASKREGLASHTLEELQTDGFAAGETANAPKGTKVTAPAEIWVDTLDNPAAKLLRARVGKVPVVEHPENTMPGVTLVVGDTFTDLRQQAPSSVALTADAVVCSPPVE